MSSPWITRQATWWGTPAYDDIARLATAGCQSPIAAVNLVDDERHRTKSIVVVDDGQGTSVSADISFRAATIATDGGRDADAEHGNGGAVVDERACRIPASARTRSPAAAVVLGRR